MFVAVNWCARLSVIVAFQPWVTRWPDGNVHTRLQPLIASPRLVTFTLAVKPPGHWAGTEYATRQPAAACARMATAMPATSNAATPPATRPTRHRVLCMSCTLTGLLLAVLEPSGRARAGHGAPAREHPDPALKGGCGKAIARDDPKAAASPRAHDQMVARLPRGDTFSAIARKFLPAERYASRRRTSMDGCSPPCHPTLLIDNDDFRPTPRKPSMGGVVPSLGR